MDGSHVSIYAAEKDSLVLVRDDPGAWGQEVETGVSSISVIESAGF